MKIVIVTGSTGLIGCEASKFFHAKGYHIAGIDNDMRSILFGREASTAANKRFLNLSLENYSHYAIDIRNLRKLEPLFERYGSDIRGIIHTAAQPSHDWAATDPHTDFQINALGTLNLLELARKHCPKSVFIFTSTNKVYGDKPNQLPLLELENRYEVDSDHSFSTHGIDETMSIDDSKHSLFGVSKVSADLLVQEYGKYFGMKTGVFRGGCLTGPSHKGTKLHGFLSYLIKSAVAGRPYEILGYKGKQVRDNIHSYDLITAFWEFFKTPRTGEVYNMGGSRHSNVSILEAIALIHKLSGIRVRHRIKKNPRIGDHIWYISDVRKFQMHYPRWKYKYDIEKIFVEILESSA